MALERHIDRGDHDLQLAVQSHRAGNLAHAEQIYRRILSGDPCHCDALHLLGVIAHQQGKNERALTLIQKAIQIDPQTSFYYCSLGDVYTALKKFDAAVLNYQKAIEVNPGLVEAHYNLANTFQLQGELENAIVSYQKALALKPNLVEAHLNLAVAYKHQNKLEAAAACYQRVLALKPDHFDACVNLGNICHLCKAYDQAVTYYQKAVDLKPDEPEVRLQLGMAFKKLNRLERSVACYRTALELKPDLVHAWKHLGRALRDLEQIEAAISCYQKALELKPDDGETYYHMGNAFRALNRFDQAVSCFRKALERDPNQALVHNNLGLVLYEQKIAEKAIWHLKKAIEIDAKNFHFWNNLGAGLHGFGRLEEAITSYETCLRLKPDDAEACNNLAVAYKDRGKIQEAIALHFKALTLKPTYSVTRSNLLLAMHYHPGYSEKQIFDASDQWWQQHGSKLADSYVHRQEPDAYRRLRVGYVSADFRQHSVSYFFLPLLETHDRDQVKVYCYSGVKRADRMTNRIKGLADHWCSIVGLSDEAVAERIYADGIDILVDLAGHTANNCLLVFARKPAPVQVSWLGYPNTTGLATMDYRFTDAQADPQGEADRYHSEILIRLPHGFLCYGAPEAAPEVGELPAAATGRITFGSFNTLPKINAEVIALWSQILHQVPASQLLLKCKQLTDEPTRRAYVEMFARHGIGVERLSLLSQTPGTREHLELYNRVDIALDPYPYNGTTTTCEALFMGVPVIVMRGDRHAGRVGVSLLTRVGLTELIADNGADYVARAVGLAQDRQHLDQLRSRLRQQMQSSPLCDADSFTRQVESAYRMMWQNWCQSDSVDDKIRPLSLRPLMRKAPRKVLISHHWAVSQIPAERFGDDVYCVNHDRHPDFGHPRVLRVPFGHAYDVTDVIKKLPNGWEPDLFVAKVDAFFNQVPVNVAQLKCPKVLILGDTQHGKNPLSRMIQYATAEKYDIYITDHKRHHLWYYWLAGIHELYWLPGLFLNPPDDFSPQRQGPFGEKILSSPSQMRVNPEFYRDKVVFIGQCGQFHPRRGRIINHLKEHISNFWAQALPQQESFVAYNRAPISLNISLNGDLNLRVFEVIAANGFLLTDLLSDESGMNLILEEERDYRGYEGLEDLKTHIRELVKHPNRIARYRRHAFDRYWQDLSPQVMVGRFRKLVSGQIIDNRFTKQSVRRIQFYDDIDFNADRLLIYEIVQERHKHLESIKILLDATFCISSVLDFLDLPRARLAIYGAGEKYHSHLSSYLKASGQLARVQFVELNKIMDVHDAYDFLLTANVGTSMLNMLKPNGVLISSGFNAEHHFSRNNNWLNNFKLEKKNGSKIFFLTKGSSSPYHQKLIQ